MQRTFPTLVILGVVAVAGWLAWGSMNGRNASSQTVIITSTTTSEKNDEPNTYECNGDGKVCPDGSVVGRTGPLCEFSECPPLGATAAAIRTTMGQVMTGLNVSITPREVLDDSRCPTNVQCIWVGTVKTRVSIKTPSSTSEETIEIGHSVQKDGYTITFTELTPSPHSGETIPTSSYRFVFTVLRE